MTCRPNDDRRDARTSSLTAVARNVVSTAGTTAEPDWSARALGLEAVLLPVSERRAAARRRSVISASEGATLTWSDGTTTKSPGPSVRFGLAVDCIGPPYPNPAPASKMVGGR